MSCEILLNIKIVLNYMSLTKLQEEQIRARYMLYSLLLVFCIFSTSSTIVYAHSNSLINDYSYEVNLSDNTDNSATIECKLPTLASFQACITLENNEDFQQKLTRKSLSNRDPPLTFIV